MHPELFRIPFTDLTVKSYGVLMVFGFMCAIYIIRKLSRGMGENEDHVTTAALYSLIAGVAGSRLFYVVHYWSQFKGRGILEIFAVWDGGLELLGGVLTTISVIVIYLRVKGLPIRRYLDILAVGLMMALAFGRIGCLFSGCCFGRPTNSCLAIHFPYNSFAYNSQVRPDDNRHREKPYMELPADYFGYMDENGKWLDAPETVKYDYVLKPKEMLSPQQKVEVSKGGKYRCRGVIPTQLYESFSALIGCALLYLHRRKGIQYYQKGCRVPFFFRCGQTFGLLFIVYGIMRFTIEFFRDDNPIGYFGLTISQNLSVALFAISVLLIIVFGNMKQTPYARR
ncbi:MAG: prolipoprotein diacylglyceryl transferase [Phycisphaerae bacterium]